MERVVRRATFSIDRLDAMIGVGNEAGVLPEDASRHVRLYR